MRTAYTLVCALVLSTGACDAAEKWPERAVKIIVPNRPGNTGDIQARVIAGKLSAKWEKPVLVENRPNAEGVIAAGAIINAEPDGYTLLAATTTMVAPNTHYSPQKVFAFVSLFARTDLFLVVSASSPIKTVRALIESRPKNYAASPFGQTIAGAELQRSTGIGAVHIPYGSEADSILAVVSGTVDYTFILGANMRSTVLKDGREVGLRAVAVLGNVRSSFLPDVPTIKEAGIADFRTRLATGGLVAPIGTPEDMVRKISADVCEIIRDPDTKALYEKFFSEAVCSSPEEYAAFAQSLR